ncbi:hypothetical protein Vadar_000977 [Vaccinium darrowii]|uniref:Uncharacterized protein n=1 Tax=Vaccinium darrowii TaxID=229202 RepID=A0ACB7Z8K8_9ERIC|nr:hypothetical protein Vadar_000977 [Vaccinium darrowii]
MAERFYRRFYMPQPIEFEMWEPHENISFQAYELLEGTAEEKLEAALNQWDMGGFRPRVLFPSWVRQTPFPLGYDLPNFSIYEGHGDPEKHIKLFFRQCGRTAQNQALCLRQFPLSLDGIAFDWYCSLDGFVVPSWDAMKSAFIQSQYFYRWDSRFLRSARERYPQEGEVITDDEHSSVGSTNKVQISDEPNVGDDNGKEIVKVCKTFLTYKRQPRNPNQGSQVPIKEGDALKEEEQPTTWMLAFTKRLHKAKGETEGVEAQTKKTFRYIPKSQRKPGASALALINPTLELKDAFVLPLRKTECTYVESYRKFVVPAKEKGTKPIVFHALGDVETKVQNDNPKVVETLGHKRPNYAENIREMLVKDGLDPEKVSSQTITPFDSVLTHAQVTALEQGKPIVATREGLGYQATKEEKFSVNMTVVERALDDGDEDGTCPLPVQSEEGDQATIDELREFKKVNIFHVKRRINARADALASLAVSLTLPDNKTITITVGERTVLHPLKEVLEVLPAFIATTKEEEEDWREPFINYLQHGWLPEDKAQRAEPVRRFARLWQKFMPVYVEPTKVAQSYICN